MSRLERVALWVLGIGMVAIGIDHFVNPGPFERIVPASLPNPRWLVLVSGFFECAGGVGVLIPKTRRAAAWGLIALYVAVFPANVNMAVHHIQLAAGDDLPAWAMWARLPFQALFIAWAYWFTRADRTPSAAPAG